MNMKILILYLIDTENTNWCCTVRAKGGKHNEQQDPHCGR